MRTLTFYFHKISRLQKEQPDLFAASLAFGACVLLTLCSLLISPVHFTPYTEKSFIIQCAFLMTFLTGGITYHEWNLSRR